MAELGQSDRTPHFDRRALTDDQRVLAEDIATAMPDRHDESCAVWSEDADGCDCPLVTAVADGLHAARVVAIEVERGYDRSTQRGEHVVRMPFSPMPTEGSGQSDRIPPPRPLRPCRPDLDRLERAVISHVGAESLWHRCGKRCAPDLWDRMGCS